MKSFRSHSFPRFACDLCLLVCVSICSSGAERAFMFRSICTTSAISGADSINHDSWPTENRYKLVDIWFFLWSERRATTSLNDDVLSEFVSVSERKTGVCVCVLAIVVRKTNCNWKCNEEISTRSNTYYGMEMTCTQMRRWKIKLFHQLITANQFQSSSKSISRTFFPSVFAIIINFSLMIFLSAVRIVFTGIERTKETFLFRLIN